MNQAGEYLLYQNVRYKPNSCSICVLPNLISHIKQINAALYFLENLKCLVSGMKRERVRRKSRSTLFVNDLQNTDNQLYFGTFFVCAIPLKQRTLHKRNYGRPQITGIPKKPFRQLLDKNPKVT